MVFTINQPASRKIGSFRFFAALLLCCVLVCGGMALAGATGQTSLTVSLKGISYSGQDWLSVPISGLFDVETVDGQALGQLRANPSQQQRAAGETDTLVIADASIETVVLIPREEGFPQGFAAAGATEVLLSVGNDSYFTAIAYAKQGLFSVRNTVAGTGEPVSGAEFLLMSADGVIQLNFTTNQQGEYTAEQTLPSGEYTLMQMKTAEGTLPLRSAATLTIPTYIGKAESIPVVTLENEPAPLSNGQAAIRVQESSVFALRGDLQDADYYATIKLTGGTKEPSTLPLKDFTLHLTPTAFVSGAGETLAVSKAISMESIAVDGLDGEFAAKVQGLGSQGEPVGVAQTIANGQSASLQGAMSVAITFVNALTGEATVPEGFQPGMITARLRYAPTELMVTQHAIVRAEVTGQVSYRYQYANTDGTGLVDAQAECKPALIALEVPNDKSLLAMAAVCEADTGAITLTLTGDANGLPKDLPMALMLPQGARVDEKTLAEGLTLLREKDRDAVVFMLENVQQGNLTIAIKAGSISALSVYVLDPCTLMKTADNPYGANIEAQSYESHPILHTLLNLTDGIFARIDCQVEESLSMASAPMQEQPLLTGIIYEDLDRSGTRTGEEPVSENQGVLLKGDYSGIYYGGVTDAQGEFAIYCLEGALEPKGTIIAVLPDNALSIGTQLTGRIELKNVTLPDEDYPISYNQMGRIQGRMILDSYQPLAGGEISLWQGSEKLATVNTDDTGAYAFDGLVQGEYRISAILPQAARAMLLSEGDTVAVTRAALETGTLALGHGQEMELSFAAVSLGALEGSVSGETVPVSGVTVELTAEDGQRTENTTDDNGSFAFADLKAGQYTLALALPEMRGVISVDGSPVPLSNPFSMELTVPTGETVRKTIAVQTTGSLSGSLPDIGEGQTITAASMAGQVSAITDGEGNFVFEFLPAGDYTVYAPLLAGKDLESDSPWQITQKGDMIWMSITIQEDEKARLPVVRYVEMTGIEGVAYVDDNGDFAYTQGEQLMSGVTVALQRRQEGTWVDVDTALTNDYGAYAFRELRTGAYRVVSKAPGNDLHVASVGPVPIVMGEGGIMCTDEIRLEEGTVLSGQSDIALTSPAELRFSAFSDSNENGIRGEYERPIAGVEFAVMDGDTVLAFGVTDATGEGKILGVAPGEHTLRVTLPSGYRVTQKGDGQGIGISCVEDQGSSVALSSPVFFESAKTLEAGAAAVPVGSFSGKVWSDLDNDGVMGAEEPGAAGVTLTLTGKKTKSTYTLLTDETGAFRFPMLRNDEYVFTAALEEGSLFAKYSQTGGDLRSVFTSAGTSASRSFVVSGAADVTNKNVGVVEAGVISGTAFFDVNYNGILDAGEPGYSGVKVEVTRIQNGDVAGVAVTDEAGVYRFSGLRGGEYRVRAILPDDGSIFSIVPSAGQEQANLFAGREGRRENTVSPVTIGNGGKAQALIGVARGAEIKGTVFFDDSYDGIMGEKEKKVSGIKVELVNSSGEPVQSATTNANGNYTFQGVMPENYTLRFLRKDHHAFTRLRPAENGGSWVKGLEGDYGVTDAFAVTMGEDTHGLNAGMLPSSTLRGVFFDDLNDNGLQDEGEAGMAGVSVRLFSEDAEIDLLTEVAADGSYFFDGAMPGTYSLTYSLPEHTELAKAAEGGNTLQGKGQEIVTDPFTIGLGTAEERPLAGGVILGTFEGTFFHDVNANGVQDDGEEFMAGLEITLTPNRTELEVAKIAIGSDGRFSITELRPAEYQLALKLPEGYIFSANLEKSNLVLDTVNSQKLSCSWQALTNRAQNAIGCVMPATMTGYVFLDENRDGAQQSSESLMSGLAFELVSESEGRVVKRTTSGEDGHMTFAGVRPGMYTVRFIMPSQAYAAGEADATLKETGGWMVQSGIAIAEGERFDRIHAGLISHTSIGGTLLLEENGQRTPLEGIAVRLTFDRPGETKQIKEVVTDENGRYRVDGLWPADCLIEAELPEGMIFVRPDDPNYATGTSVIAREAQGMGASDTIKLEMARHLLDENIIYIRPAKIGDIAWVDTNRNGLLDADEPMLPGVTVSLMSGDTAVQQTKTDAFGYYLFDQVYPGTYTLRSEAYPQLGITKSIPELRIISSCLISGDGKSALSDPFSVLSGTVNMNFDLGFVLSDGQSMPEAVGETPEKDWTGAYVSGS